MSSAAIVVTILAGAVVVLGGLGALIRAIWRVANVLRDNTTAIHELTKRFDDLGATTTNQFKLLSDRVYELEHREFGRHPKDAQPGARTTTQPQP